MTELPDYYVTKDDVATLIDTINRMQRYIEVLERTLRETYYVTGCGNIAAIMAESNERT